MTTNHPPKGPAGTAGSNSDSGDNDIKPDVLTTYNPSSAWTPSTPKRANSKSEKSQVTPKSKSKDTPSPGKKRSSANNPSGWTPDKKEAVIARLLTLGIKSANMTDLAAELSNAIQIGHKGNLRDKAAKAVRGD